MKILVERSFDVIDRQLRSSENISHRPTIKITLPECEQDDNSAWKARDELAERIALLAQPAQQQEAAVILNKPKLQRIGFLTEAGKQLPHGTKLYTHPAPQQDRISALPGMWDESDLSGGETDMPAQQQSEQPAQSSTGCCCDELIKFGYREDSGLVHELRYAITACRAAQGKKP